MEEQPLWRTGPPPHSKPSDLKEYQADNWGAACTFDITEPTLTFYDAASPESARAVLIVPGGGYETVATEHEGHEIAQVFAAKGITAAVLKYRLPNPKSSPQPHLVPLSDTRKALSDLREYARQNQRAETKVGVLGFSAGGHLANGVSLLPTSDPNERPDFSLLLYGVSALNEINKRWLEDKLYHRPLTPEELERETLLSQIDENTPPAFLVHAMDDKVCLPTQSTLLAQALEAAGVPFELHLFPKGGHGFGKGRKEDGTDQWVELAINWIERQT